MRTQRYRRWLVATLGSALFVATSLVGSASGGAAKNAGDRQTLNVGSEFVLANGAFFDPIAYNSNPAPQTYMNMIYDSMIHETSKGYEPGLATKWSAPDASTVLLTLRKGTFQDGTPFNAAAVKAAWDRLIGTTNTRLVQELRSIRSVEALGDLEVRVNLTRPLAGDWLTRSLVFSHYGAGVVSPAALAKAGSASAFSSNPVGAGPYKFESYTKDQKITLAKFDAHWNAKAYHFKTINFINVAQGAPTVTALASGTIDVATLGPNDVAGAKAQGLKVVTEAADTINFLTLCMTKAPFNSAEVRNAVATGLNRAELIKGAYRGLSTLNPIALPPSHPYYAADLAKQVKYKPDAAAKAIAAAGAKGTAVELLIGTQRPEDALQAQIIQQQLGKLGLNVTIKSTPDTVAELAKTDPHMYLVLPPVASHSFVLDPVGIINACSNPTTALLATFNKARDPTLTPVQAKAAWRTYQQEAMTTNAVAYLSTPNNIIGTSKDVKGVGHVYGAQRGLVLEGVRKS